MLSISHFLSAAAILLLVSCALARSLHDDETLSKAAAAAMLAGEEGEGEGADPYDDPAALADLWSLLVAAAARDVTARQAMAVGAPASSKRSWPGGFPVPSSMKRKMFWTPLGHLPASARLGRPRNLRPSLEDSGSPVFRYG